MTLQQHFSWYLAESNDHDQQQQQQQQSIGSDRRRSQMLVELDYCILTGGQSPAAVDCAGLPDGDGGFFS
jgi:hypothetical protein